MSLARSCGTFGRPRRGALRAQPQTERRPRCIGICSWSCRGPKGGVRPRSSRWRLGASCASSGRGRSRRRGDRPRDPGHALTRVRRRRRAVQAAARPARPGHVPPGHARGTVPVTEV
jgi:hypothetical protein